MFELDDEQIEKLDKWVDEQDKKEAQKQGKDQPYYGAIGGRLTYMFTPTTLGLITKVKHANGEEIDLSYYDEW